MKRKKVYVASPLGFYESGRVFLKTIHKALEEQNLEVVSPWELTDDQQFSEVFSLPFGESRRKEWGKLNSIIGENNAEGIKSSDYVFAVLDGADVDSGTASEIGFAYALGKKIIGYRNDFRFCGDNEGAVVNLQVEYFIRKSGGTIISSLSKKELQELF